MMKLQFPHHLHASKYLCGMRGIFQFGSQILSCPVFIMFPIPPQTTMTDIIDESAVRHPGFRAVLPITQGQLGKTELGQFHTHPERAILQENLQRMAADTA